VSSSGPVELGQARSSAKAHRTTSACCAPTSSRSGAPGRTSVATLSDATSSAGTAADQASSREYRAPGNSAEEGYKDAMAALTHPLEKALDIYSGEDYRQAVEAAPEPESPSESGQTGD